MHPQRVRTLKQGKGGKGPVCYWMSRDQRTRDNWALLHAQELSLEMKAPLLVVFCLFPHFLQATLRQYAFMIKGLKEVETFLERKNIPFYCLRGEPKDQVPQFVRQVGASCLITEFDPLRIKKDWKGAVVRRIEIPVLEVDAHNIIPCWIASPKQEFGAYTFRPKVQRLPDDFMEEFPSLKKHPILWREMSSSIHWDQLLQKLPVDPSVSEVTWIIPGEKAALQCLKKFIQYRLPYYHQKRNDPNQKGQSDLSPYLHFGQISAQRIALEVQKAGVAHEPKKAFLEELIIRRELSDNFCYYNPAYNQTEGFPQWAQRTLRDHRSDPRMYLYSLDQLEKARTHDHLWNAAQMEMVRTGKMHGYLRMYWAKKILEWTESPEEAIKTAVYLNDKYELDGRDPNGYTGIAWSIGGVHDRAWGERQVFGKIRYMSYQGAKSKFDVGSYIAANPQ